MTTTTVRVDVETHALLIALSREAGSSMISTVREAATALRRQRFAGRVADELTELREDPVAWADYLAEADATSVTDGIG